MIQDTNSSVNILAALALMNQGYALLSECTNGKQMVRLATECIGQHGYLGGMAASSTSELNSKDEVHRDPGLQFTAIARLAVVLPLICFGASARDGKALAEFGYCVGMVQKFNSDAAEVERNNAGSNPEGLTPFGLRAISEHWAKDARVAIEAHFIDVEERTYLLAVLEIIVDSSQVKKSIRLKAC
ncbi:MAG: hypothetical protein ACYTDT_02300 [Planctomycetota bacterium]